MKLENFFEDEDEDAQVAEVEQKYHLRKPIRPYLCSTPEDFNEEKDFLAKEIFPEIHKLCKLRGGNFLPYDIRWNPNGDETESGNLLKLNLDYITKSSPFFICLLGESYGPYRYGEKPPLPKKITNLEDLEEMDWMDKNYLMAASAGYTWVLQESHQNTSFTELEIIQAAFLCDNKYCHFYFRQPEHLDVKFGNLPEEKRTQLSKVHLPENENADLSIRDLKQRIVKKALPVKYYRTNEELGRHVIKDWTLVIDAVYPALEHPLSTLESEEYSEWVANEVFADSRRQVFVTSVELNQLKQKMTSFALEVLDETLFETEEKMVEKPYSILNVLKKKEPEEARYKSIMVVHGDRGSGKSTLISNWIQKFKVENPDVKVLCQYVGCSGRSSDISVFLRQCIKELRENYLMDCSNLESGLTEEDQPWTFQEVCQAFIAALSLGPVVIVVDGLDEIGNTLGLTIRQVKELKWLPFPLPPHCRIIFTSCRSDLTYHSLSTRKDTIMHTVPSFNTPKIRTAFLDEAMLQHFDHLSEENIQQVHAIKLSHKPLFMSLLAGEMCCFSVYTGLFDYLEEVGEKISSLRDYCLRCFQRWSREMSWTKENLYGEVDDEDLLELEGWIPDTLRLLAVSRTGLSQSDLFTLLRGLGYRNSKEVRNFQWLQFCTCFKEWVYELPSGQIQFSHQHLKEIVEYVLLHSLKAGSGSGEVASTGESEKEWKGQKNRFHKQLAKYFLRQPFSQRVLEELPWQLLMSGDMDTLLQVLNDPLMIEGFLDEKRQNPSNKLDLAFFWSLVKEEGKDVCSMYQKLLIRLGIMEEEKEEIFHEQNGEDLELDSVTSEISSHEDETIGSSRENVAMGIPTIVTYPPNRELSAVTEESITSSLGVRTPHHHRLEETVIEDPINEQKESEKSRTRDKNGAVFLTETKAETPGADSPLLYQTNEMCNTIKIAWLIANFLKDLGHVDVTEKILTALNKKLIKSYPLENDDMLIHARVQEALGTYCQSRGELELSQKYFTKSLRMVSDLSELDEDSALNFMEVENLKGKLLSHLGNLRLNEGFVESAEDLLTEARDAVETSGNLTAKATIMYNLGLLRMQQGDFILAESSLRQALNIREQWFGKSHPLVAEVLYSLAQLMGNPDNYRGFNRVRSEGVYRRVLKIREDCLGREHLAVGETLFQLGKLLEEEINYAAKCEAVQLLRRALDIRTTKLGGDHIDTRAVRQYLSQLEISLKMGRYEFGPARLTDTRTPDRPFSKLSWREKDLVNLDKRSRSRSASRNSVSGIRSRPSSYKEDHGQSMSRYSSVSHLSASEKLLMDADRPRLLHRDYLERKLKVSSPSSEMQQPRRQVTVEIKVDDEVDRSADFETRVTDPQIDSFGDEIRQTDSLGVMQETKRTQFAEQSESGPVKLFKRYSSAGSSRSSLSRQNERSVIRGNSAKSNQSSHITGFSSSSRASLRSGYSRRSVAGPHAITPGNTQTVTTGPNSTLDSLIPRSPRDLGRTIHHRSAWYHVPGRYATSGKPFPPKRSQKTAEAKELEQRLLASRNSSRETSHQTLYRKSPPKQNKEKSRSSRDINKEFGMTVKGIGPVISNGYYSNPPHDYVVEPYIDQESEQHNTTVKFKEAVFVE
ncbi:tetratricopeptide repeat protein 41-like isoform X2 [Crassostrea virginica]